MKEIGIAATIIRRRHDMMITQDELANSLGITKASVSKWETGLSYPDIVMLPKLAAFFNISIDELLNYTPQLTQQEIAKIYNHLADAFASKPFDEVNKECQELIKKYYSCFPFLLQMSVLFLNHCSMAKSPEDTLSLLKQSCDLCIRIKHESDDATLIRETISIESIVHMLLAQLYAASNPEQMNQELGQIFDLLGKEIKPPLGDNDILISAYQMQGDTKKALQLCQAEIYIDLMNLVGSFPKLMSLYPEQPEKVIECIQKCESLIELFHFETLNANTSAIFYFQASIFYMTQQNETEALNMLVKYANVCELLLKDLKLHGNDFFNEMDRWFDSYAIGIRAPRSRQLVYESVLTGITNNPIFTSLAENPIMKNVLNQIRRMEKC